MRVITSLISHSGFRFRKEFQLVPRVLNAVHQLLTASRQSKEKSLVNLDKWVPAPFGDSAALVDCKRATRHASRDLAHQVVDGGVCKAKAAEKARHRARDKSSGTNFDRFQMTCPAIVNNLSFERECI